MSRVVTEDDIFQILRDYERRIKELERAATGVIPNENQGPAGPPGERWFSGSVAPTGSVPADAVVGDWYLNTTTGDVYEKTSTSAWTLQGNIKGPQGTQGIQGVQGNPGAPGISDAKVSTGGLLSNVGTWTDVAAADLAITLPCTGRPVICTLHCKVGTNNDTNKAVPLRTRMDAGTFSPEETHWVPTNTIGFWTTLRARFVPSAGNHTFCPQFSGNGATTVWIYRDANNPVIFTAEEF
jgi:hypothetical protein